jgi:hypothetical protein
MRLLCRAIAVVIRCGLRRGDALLPKTQAVPYPRHGRQTLAMTQFSKARSACVPGLSYRTPTSCLATPHDGATRASRAESDGRSSAETPSTTTLIYHDTGAQPNTYHASSPVFIFCAIARSQLNRAALSFVPFGIVLVFIRGQGVGLLCHVSSIRNAVREGSLHAHQNFKSSGPSYTSQGRGMCNWNSRTRTYTIPNGTKTGRSICNWDLGQST